jgi:hypothetical protein
MTGTSLPAVAANGRRVPAFMVLTSDTKAVSVVYRHQCPAIPSQTCFPALSIS